jgi:muramoyltetrapeptide carboxypeptidase
MIPRLPPPLRPGDRVGVAALSGPVDPDALAAGLRAIDRLGFVPVPAANLGSRHDLFAGTEDERVDGLHRLAADADIAAIFFARGGHGVLPLLPALDWNLLGRRPRAFVGYSDLTPLLDAVVRRLGWIAFHGPMVASDLARGLDPDEQASLLAALRGELPVEVPLGGFARGSDGSASGPLRGGCLSMLEATLGTPWACDLAGSVVLLEDVAEPLYRIDRMLTHLHLSGSLARVHGIVIGSMRGTDEAPEAASTVPSRVALMAPGALVGWGAPAGHGRPNWTLPLGATATLEPRRARLVLELPERER